MATLYTIGHSTRTIEDFTGALQAHAVEALVDIRSFPMSRRLPHFNREALERSLAASGIEYVWEKRLGGRRKKTRTDSPNTGLRSESFRNYADYMLAAEFRVAIDELVARAEQKRVAIMCAERVYFNCHRMLVSDWLAAHGHTVLHIDATGPARPHRITPEAHLEAGQLIYRPPTLFF